MEEENTETEGVYEPTRYRAFYVLLEPCQDAKLPISFVETFGERIDVNVTLVDSKKDSFNVLMSRKKEELAFSYGIEDLLYHYQLPWGGWMRCFYLGGSEFHIQMMDRDFSLPKVSRVSPRHYEFGWKDEDPAEEHYDSGPETDEWSELECCDVKLFSSHFKKNRKALPATFVRKAIGKATPVFCVLRDQVGRRFYCEYQYGKTKDEFCTITIGWLDFVKSNNLREGSVVKLGILKGDPSVIHAKDITNQLRNNNNAEEGGVEVDKDVKVEQEDE